MWRNTPNPSYTRQGCRRHHRPKPGVYIKYIYIYIGLAPLHPPYSHAIRFQRIVRLAIQLPPHTPHYHPLLSTQPPITRRTSRPKPRLRSLLHHSAGRAQLPLSGGRSGRPGRHRGGAQEARTPRTAVGEGGGAVAGEGEGGAHRGESGVCRRSEAR